VVSVRIAVRVMLGFGLESRSDETFFSDFFVQLEVFGFFNVRCT